MKAFPNINILKTIETLGYFLKITLSLLQHLFDPVITHLSAFQPTTQQKNIKENIAKQPTTTTLTQIPSFQASCSLLCASETLRDNLLSLASQSARPSSRSVSSVRFSRDELSPISMPSLTTTNQSTGPPIFECHSSPFPIREIREICG